MATGQTLLDLMEVFNNELQCQPGEEDVVRALKALNVSQDFLESQLAVMKNTFLSTTTTVAVANGVATSSFPTGWIRVDYVQMLDPTTLRPVWDIDKLAYPPSTPSPALLTFLIPVGGRPTAYWTNATTIFWDPLPTQTDTVRVYGLAAGADITASATFAYPDFALFPIASFATQLMKMGVGDQSGDISALAREAFKTVLEQFADYNQDASLTPCYKFKHDA